LQDELEKNIDENILSLKLTLELNPERLYEYNKKYSELEKL